MRTEPETGSKTLFKSKIKGFFARFKNLPKQFWYILISVFGIVDFLTWSIFSEYDPKDRYVVTFTVIGFSLLFAIIYVLIRPSETEKVVEARRLTKEARELFNQGQYWPCIPLLEKSSLLDKENTHTFTLYGRVLVNVGKFSESIAPLSYGLKISQIQGNKHKILLHRAIAYYHLGDFGNAHDDLNQILQNSPSHIEALTLKALIWLKTGKEELALQEIDKALDRRPTYLCAMAVKTMILQRQNKGRMAREQLRKCDCTLPEEGEDLYYVAMANNEMKNFNEALSCLEMAIQKDYKCAYRAVKEPFLSNLFSNKEFIRITNLKEDDLLNRKIGTD